MRIGFVVNDVMTEESFFTSVRMAIAAANRGHEIWLIGSGDFTYDPDDFIRATAVTVSKSNYRSLKAFLGEMQGPKAVQKEITVDDLDVLMLRYDPSLETGVRTWAQTAGLEFGRLAMRRGVIVLNDPNGLAKAMNKMYFQLFPEEVRPRTLITRSRKEIKGFIKQMEGMCILKPLQGSGGKGVFLVTPESRGNINQMIEAVTRDGYVVAQEYIPEAVDGDTRLFVMNGLPLRYRGKYAAFRRIRTEDDIRSNFHAGGKKGQAVISEDHLRIVEIVRPKLVQDGMFLVGLDIAGSKLMEVNVFCPGGLGVAKSLENVNFVHPVLDAIERKVKYMNYYRRSFDNQEIATL